ncbi:outer membrane protein assembly factor BamC [Pseudomonas matsuisoli]|uniref:Lipoprotein n=1 Tax=Pseudomonas matsuisoli TaxID=1515666 RepID=A0A917PIU0_9PSED|nr:outer membrane protein assembly factor BamC [Pseudomonas matsuisoli]GGJ80944.1 lipoprotein [Pseudomonas matsuisoli]
MKRYAGLSVLALVITSTSGCGWLWGDDGYFRDRGSDYLEARQTPPMQVPSDVQAKRLDPLLPIPANVASTHVSRTDYEVPRPQPIDVGTDMSEFSLQESTDQRWILAQREPSQMWTVTRQFFEMNGFRIAEERPHTGEFVTAWQPVDQLASDMASRLSARGEDLAGHETRLRVRIEPGVARNTSEVYVASASRPVGSTANVDFPARSGKPAVEAVLLDDLLSSLTGSANQSDSISLLAANSYDAPDRVNLTQDGSGNPVLGLVTDFDRAWSSVGRALQNGDVRVEDLNRSNGLYYINLAEGAANPNEKPGFFSRLFGGGPSQEEIDARAERYQVRLSTVGDNVQVTVEQGIEKVAPADVSRRILTLIQNNLG